MTLTQDVITETYKDMKNLIKKIAWNWWKTHGGDVEEILTDADGFFVECLYEYEPGRAELSTYLFKKIPWMLSSQRRKEHKLHTKSLNDSFDPDDDEFSSSNEPSIIGTESIVDMLDSLSEDAKELLSIVETSWEGNTWKALRKHGWQFKRIYTTMKELKGLT